MSNSKVDLSSALAEAAQDAENMPEKTGDTVTAADKSAALKTPRTLKTKEFGGREGPEPTRYGDWENKGIISDF